jgi:hypothetical protein
MNIKLVLVAALAACGSSNGGPMMTSDAKASGGDAGNGGGDGGIDVNQSGTRIKMKVLKTPDGAKVFSNSYDTQRNEDCVFGVAGDGVMRCLPYQSVAYDYGSYFSDAACTQPVALSYSSCAAPSYILVRGAACPYGMTATRVYTVGAAHASFYTKSGTTCSGPTTVATYTLYSYGAEVAPSSFQSATTSIE